MRAVKGNPANHLPVLTLGGLGVSRILWLVSFSLFAVGLWLFDTFRFCRRAAQLEKATGGHLLEGGSTPTDIHNYTGWQDGGRSETMDALPEAVDADSE